MNVETNIQDSFEYQAEQAKVNFQACLTALLEWHADIQHKITIAKGAKKTGIWLEMSEAEIISGHVFECVGELMGAYKVIDNTNRLLHINNKALQAIARKDIRASIEDFKADKITSAQFSERLNDFIGIRKPSIAA